MPIALPKKLNEILNGNYLSDNENKPTLTNMPKLVLLTLPQISTRDCKQCPHLYSIYNPSRISMIPHPPNSFKSKPFSLSCILTELQKNLPCENSAIFFSMSPIISRTAYFSIRLRRHSLRELPVPPQSISYRLAYPTNPSQLS